MVTYHSPRSDPKDLETFGPRLEIEVGPPIIGFGGARPRPLPGSFSRMPALIDTGAGRTVLTPEAVAKVSLTIVDYATLSRAGGVTRAAVYAASIQFPYPKLAPIELIQVIGCELPHQPIQCLIGRDILSRWLFTYNGSAGEWTIEEKDRAPRVEPPEIYDVYICYASEDKSFVEPLAAALKDGGITVWYDKDRITWGDDLRNSIDEGLLNSRFGIVVFSKAFFKRKRWTEHELNGLFAKEKHGEKVILPIWHEITQEDLAGYSSSLVDRIALDSRKNSIPEIVRHLKSLLSRTP